MTYEKVPPDYSMLKLHHPAEHGGGDTLWASGYEAYERLSPPFRTLAESLTATHFQPDYLEVNERFEERVFADVSRGSPENVGFEFKAEQ